MPTTEAPDQGSADGGDVRAIVESTTWPYKCGPFECFDQRFVVRTTDGELQAFLDDAFCTIQARSERAATTYFALPPDGQERGFASRESQRLGRPASSPGAMLGRLIWGINRQVIEGSLHRAVFHSAAVARDGDAVLLIAPSESGKTTLTAKLVDRGWSYLTDEATIVNQDLMLDGYPKPLSIDRGAWTLLPHLEPSGSPRLMEYHRHQWQVPGHHIGSVRRRARLRMIVFPSVRRDRDTVLEPVSPAQSVMAASMSMFRTGEPKLGTWRVRRLAAMASAVPAYSLVQSDLGAASEQIAAALDVLVRA